MKFSYKILKNLVPAIKSREDLVEKLESHLFEVESVAGDMMDIKILPNRYSDAACYNGLAREISVMYGKDFNFKSFDLKSLNIKKGPFEIINKVPKLCRRMSACYFEGIKISLSPKWLKEALESSGIRSINNLVDITNYVTLETGQPMHAFDFDKMTGGQLVVRQSKSGEIVETLDGQKFNVDSSIIVLADKKDPLDIAGIKGGKKAEITDSTKNILLTAGNFDGTSIYKTSRKIGLTTDASVRFSHNISPELVGWGIIRATELILKLCGGKAGGLADNYSKKPSKNIIKFDIEKFNKISGLDLKEKQALNYLKKLGFLVNGLLVTAPLIRTDIEIFEDLVEEIMRIYGYEELKAQAPVIFLKSYKQEDQINFKDRIKKILINMGLSEVYNYSFSNKGDIKLENPINKDCSFLRHSLESGLVKNIEDNFRFFQHVGLFELGKVFSYPDKELFILGVAIGDKKEKTIFELKGIVGQLLSGLGLTDYSMENENSERLRIKSNGAVLGYIRYLREQGGKISLAEVNLDELLHKAQEEREYEPISKYPSITRDLSILISLDIRVNKIMEIIEASAPQYLDDVDLIDSYEGSEVGEGQQGLTFRLIFLSEEKTLTDKEVDEEFKKVTSALINSLGVEIR